MIEMGPMKVGLFCGKGNLPRQIIHHCHAHQIPLFAIAFEGQTPKDTVHDISHRWCSLGSVSLILTTLKQQGVTHIVFAGAIERPSLRDLNLDMTGLAWMARLGLKALGDDGLLSAATSLLQHEGFELLPASLFSSDLLCPLGALTVNLPSPAQETDIALGKRALTIMSSIDIGQAVVVAEGRVIAVEAAEGTTAMIHRAGTLCAGGVLIKIMKEGQNKLVDLPSVGPDTVQQAVDAGLAGLALGAHTTQLIQREEMIDAANKSGLFVIGIA